MYCRKKLLGYAEEFSHFFWQKSRERVIDVKINNYATGPQHVRRRSLGASNELQLSLNLKRAALQNTKLRSRVRENHLVAEMNDCSLDNVAERYVSEREKVRRCLFTFRYLEQTEYGKTFVKSPSRTDCVSVVSYNVLSQSLLNAHRYLYEQSNRKDLTWPSRKIRLLEEFRLLNADILCLQEVEANDLTDFYEVELRKLGYKGVYKQRTGDKVDGCAIYYKADKFKVVKQQRVELFRNIRLLDRDNIGIILRLRSRTSKGDEFVIATTHLLYNPRRSDIRLTQTQIMLAEIERVAYNSPGVYCPVIFTGDMNYKPNSAVYQLVTGGSLEYEGMTDAVALKRRLLPSYLGVTDRCQYTSSLEKRDEHDDDPLYATGVLSHDLNLQSVYSHVRDGLPEATTRQETWHTVDYIFYSQAIRRGIRQEGQLKLISRLSLPTSREAANELQALPNDSCGSDHLPLFADFHLTKESC